MIGTLLIRSHAVLLGIFFGHTHEDELSVCIALHRTRSLRAIRGNVQTYICAPIDLLREQRDGHQCAERACGVLGA